MDKNCCDCEFTYSDNICECELFNKYEEAIRDIKLAIQPVCGGISLETAIEALEKQIPKRPKADNNGNYAEYFEEWLECPECGEAIPEYTSRDETECYCLRCGQKLSWED